MKVYLVFWEYGKNDVEGIFLTKDDAEKAIEMLNAARGSSPHYFFEQYEVEDFKTFEARMNLDG